MKNWKEYQGHKPEILGKRNKYDNTIYTFDIETTSYYILNDKIFIGSEYLNLSEEDKKEAIFMSNMYIWQLGINDQIYFGRTFDELYNFLKKIEILGTSYKKFCFVHNLSFEFQFLRNAFLFKKVFARKSRHVMKFELEEFNFEFRCTLYMTNAKLEQLPELYNLNTEKLTGYLDYNKGIRNSLTKLSEEELKYCENDCLVVYELIKQKIEEYGNIKSIPLTLTGIVRKEFREKTINNWSYKNYTKKSINIDPHVYNLLVSAFSGGYTHSSWIYTRKSYKRLCFI